MIAGSRIRMGLNFLEMSEAQIGREIGVNGQTISRAIHEKPVSSATIRKIEEFFAGKVTFIEGDENGGKGIRMRA